MRRTVLAVALLAGLGLVASLWVASEPRVATSAAAESSSARPAQVTPDPAATLDTPRGPAPSPEPPASSNARPEAPPIQRTERAEAPRAEPWSAPVELLFTHAETGQGLPLISVGGALSGLDGRVASPEAHEQGTVRLAVKDVLTGKLLSGLISDKIEHGPDSGTRVRELDLGPTFGFAIERTGPGSPGQRLYGTLIERGPRAADRRVWKRVALSDEFAGQRWMRYPTQRHAPLPGWTAQVSITVEGSGPGSMDSDRVDVAGTVGVFSSLGVSLRARTGQLRGRVVDGSGAPHQGRVVLLKGALESGSAAADSDGEAEWMECLLDPEGTYSFEGVQPGLKRVMVQPSQGAFLRAEVEIVAGAVTERDFVLNPPAAVGSISGKLRGPPQDNSSPFGIVHLESEDASFRRATAAYTLFNADRDDPSSDFEFADVPEGTYRVWVDAVDGRSYTPNPLVVTAPTDTADFRTDELLADSTVDFFVTISDARTGALIEDAVFMFRVGSIWFAEVEDLPGGRIDEVSANPEQVYLIVSAPGYVPQYVQPGVAVREGSGMRLDIELQPGHGYGLLVLDAERAAGAVSEEFGGGYLALGVPGARVLANGSTVGTAGPGGVAIAQSAAPIDDFRIEAPGWSTIMLQRFEGAGEPHNLGIVLMARD